MAEFNRGKALLLLDQPQSAIEAFEKSIERNPADIRAYLELADLQLKQKDARKSAFAARRAIEFYPQDYRAWFALGRALQAQNDRTGALEAFQKVQKFAPPETDEYSRASTLIKMIRTQ
jgi:tetratricopeptide (TPR) repeat protein